MSWLTGWLYRKPVTLSRDSGAVTDYQVKLLVGESSGASGEDVDCEGHCLATFSDLRFTSANGTTILSHWVESISGTTPNQLATVWVKFDSIGTGDTTFYMYYSRTSSPLFAGAIRISPNGDIWAGHYSDGTIRKSTNGGLSWTTKYTFSVGSGIIYMIFIAANGYIYSSRTDSDILIRSTDGGENWSTCLTLSGTSDSVVWHMTQDSLGNIYVGEYSTGDGTENSAYVYKSIDNGENWTTIWNNPDSARHIHICSVDPYTDSLYVSQDGGSGGATNDKLLRSDDQGENWTTLGSNGGAWMPTSIAFGDGYRLFGGEGYTGFPGLIYKTVNDTVFTTVYTPPSTDDEGFWNGGETNNDGVTIFSLWTQKDNERPTVIVTKNEGVTWEIIDYGATNIGHDGYLGISNADENGHFYVTRYTEQDIVRYNIDASMLPLNISNVLTTMVKGDNGVVGNFTEAVSGTAAFSHVSGKYTFSEDSIDDASLAGIILPDWNFEAAIDSLDIFTGIAASQLTIFGLMDFSSIADAIGNVTEFLAQFRFLIVRYDANHPTLANKIACYYRASSGTLTYWDGSGWTTTATTFTTSGSIVSKIWSDGTNILADVLSGGVSVFTSPASIAIATVMAFSAGKAFVWGESRTDSYGVSPTIKNYYVREYVEPEPVWGVWGEEETQTVYVPRYGICNFQSPGIV